MAMRTEWKQKMADAGKATVVASLCAVMAVGPALAEGGSSAKPSPVAVSTTKLTDEQKELHALNRMTFGPRPGDLDAVRKLGLHAWFERQLNPASIDDSAFENQIATNFPAMLLSQGELAQRFPTPQALRQMARQGTPLPSDPVLHAIYADSMAAYERRLQAAGAVGADGKRAKAAGAQDASMQAGTMQTGAMQTGAMQAGATQAGAMGSDTDKDTAMADALALDAVVSGKPVAAAGKQRMAGVEYTGIEPSAVVAMAPDERMRQILSMSPDQAFAFNRELLPRERLALMAGLSPTQVETLTALQGPIRVVAAETLEARLLRDVSSDRQLEAVMTDFWLNHFNVYVKKNGNEAFLLNAYERDTVRPRALGKFEDLLVATAQSPAMLVYLDNWLSIGPDSQAAQRGKRVQQFADKNPDRKGLAQLAQVTPKGINENYAREVIELHTIGVRCEVSADHTAKELDPSCGAGYTQADVTNVAKVLTGWTIDRPYGTAVRNPLSPQPRDAADEKTPGGFIFQQNRHEGGSKQVLGRMISNGGEREGLEVLHMLATSPATAQFISHKLAVRFVSDDPPRALEDRMAATFLKTDGDIKQVLRTMFDSPEFWTPAVYRAKVKTPIEFLVSALRASDATVTNALPLVQAMDRLGMPLYGMQTPNGYSWTAEPWVSTTALVSRMNFSLVLSGDLLPGTRTNWPKLLGESVTETTPSPQTEARLETLLLGQPAALKTRNAVLEQAAKPGQALEARKSLALEAPAGGADMVGAAKQGKVAARRVGYGGGGSMTDMAAGAGHDGPVETMAGLLLGSPEFQRR